MDSFRAQTMSSRPLLCVAWLQSGVESHIILQHEDMPYLFGRCIGVGHLKRGQSIPFHGLMNRACVVLDHCIVVLAVLISAH